MTPHNGPSVPPFNEFGPDRDLLGYPRRRRLLLTGMIVLPLVAVGRVFGLVHRDMFGYRRLA